MMNQDNAQPVLVTGAAGFIGFHLARALLQRGVSVVGVDSVNEYYDPTLKRARLRELQAFAGFTWYQHDLADATGLQDIFAKHRFTRVLHLAAQAGVRYSMSNPSAYTSSNIDAFLNLLECCRAASVKHLLYASSSSVYGGNDKIPFSEDDAVNAPLNLYATTKRTNELMAYTYASLYGLPSTGLRFFTVYGPWGRPDMAIFGFAEKMLRGEPIDLFNRGEMARDFTFIDDVVDAVLRLYDRGPSFTAGETPTTLFNVGYGNPVGVRDMVRALEDALGVAAVINELPMQPGEVLTTHADISRLQAATGFTPQTALYDGVAAFAQWYQEYRHTNKEAHVKAS